MKVVPHIGLPMYMQGKNEAIYEVVEYACTFFTLYRQAPKLLFAPIPYLCTCILIIIFQEL